MQIISIKDKYDKISECNSLIYSYFLYFCGILTLMKEGDTKEGKAKNELKKFFDSNQNTEHSDKALFFSFLKIQIDLVDQGADNIETFVNLRNCLRSEDHNFVFDAIEREQKLLKKIIQETPKRVGCRKLKLDEIFPNLEQYIKKSQLNSNEHYQDTIASLMQSVLAKLYFFAEDYCKCNEFLDKAIKNFHDNSYALVQEAYHLVYLSKVNSDDSDSDYIDNGNKESKASSKSRFVYIQDAEKMIKNVIDLIDNGAQFKGDNYKAFKYGLEFEAILCIAYINYKKGLYDDADDNYDTAERLIKKLIEREQKYLGSILSLNRARNNLEKGDTKSRIAAKKELVDVIKKYNNANGTFKVLLVDIAGRAHINLGAYYLAEALYNKAEREFNKALEFVNAGTHARYNLGVLYYRKDDKERALKFIKNASNLDPKFDEAKNALQKLGAATNKGSLGAEWFEWWFEMVERDKKEKT